MEQYSEQEQHILEIAYQEFRLAAKKQIHGEDVNPLGGGGIALRREDWDIGFKFLALNLLEYATFNDLEVNPAEKVFYITEAGIVEYHQLQRQRQKENQQAFLGVSKLTQDSLIEVDSLLQWLDENIEAVENLVQDFDSFSNPDATFQMGREAVLRYVKYFLTVNACRVQVSE